MINHERFLATKTALNYFVKLSLFYQITKVTEIIFKPFVCSISTLIKRVTYQFKTKWKEIRNPQNLLLKKSIGIFIGFIHILLIFCRRGREGQTALPPKVCRQILSVTLKTQTLQTADHVDSFWALFVLYTRCR